jgi:hypothetical protein
MLKNAGTATFMVDESGAVSYVNPLLVLLSSHAQSPPPGMVARRGRPIIMSGRPQFVELDANGTVYEVDYVDPDDVE